MNILISGITGFLGSALLHIITSEKSHDDELFFLSSKPIYGFNTILHQNYRFARTDLPSRIDAVLYLNGFVPKSVCDQKNGFKHASAILNLKYFIENLPAIPNRFVFCSSTEVYGRKHNCAIDEDTPVSPYDLYSAQKLMCEGIVTNYCNRNNVQNTILRLGPMFGPNDMRKECFLPGIILRAIDNKPILLTASKKTKRNYMYVSDAALAIWNVLHSEEISQIINVTSNKNYTIGEIAETVIQETGSKSEIVLQASDDSVVSELVFDNSMMKKMIKINEHTLKTAIRETYEALKNG